MVSLLQTKVWRDVGENRWAFLAISGICSLGIALFSGLNLYVSTIETKVSSYYERANLADYWVYTAGLSDSGWSDTLLALDGVLDAQRRKVVDLPLDGASGALLRLHAVEEAPRINVPDLLAGSLLDGDETDALLLDSRFAEAHGLSVGDRLATRNGDGLRHWLIKGIIRDVEYVYYAPEGLTIPDYHTYGFAYTNASALPDVPFNEIILTVDEEVSPSQDDVAQAVRAALGGANILSRAHQASARKVADSMTGIRQIGWLFSIAFFLTAALVTWITVSRLLENQRQHLGTLRSLGFSKAELIGRYALFGVLLTVPSAIVGGALSRYVIAQSLYAVGIRYYTIDATGVEAFSPHLILAALGVAAVTCGGAALSCHRLLRAGPAELMRPRPPAQGHRILLERITPVWRSLSFSGKIVARNLFRNKTRMLLGLIGVAGSAALILCGFGLMDSINGMLERAFDETIRYDAEVKLRTPLPIEALADVYDALHGAEHIDATMAFGVYVHGRLGDVQNPYLVVMDEGQTSLAFRDVDGHALRLPEAGVLMTPRMAEALSVGIGDTLTAEGLDGVALELTVAGVVDFPVGNEIYLSRTAFDQVSDLPFRVRTLLIRGPGRDLEALKADPRIALVETKDEMRTNMRVVLEALQLFQVILIVFSGLLAFAVMLVLGYLNFHERTRELATLKVLGFYDNEMKQLVLSENIWITLVGLPIGYGLGFSLLGVILQQATTPDLEISPLITALSIGLGFAVVVGFTLLVNHVIGRGFKAIDMVTSLKSVE